MSLIEIRLRQPARCGQCQQVASAISFHPIADGATTILTELTWLCPAGHATPSGLPQIYVAAGAPVEHQLCFTVAPAA